MQNKNSNVPNASFEVKSSDREPIAGNPHDGFCGGGATHKSGSLLTPRYGYVMSKVVEDAEIRAEIRAETRTEIRIEIKAIYKIFQYKAIISKELSLECFSSKLVDLDIGSISSLHDISFEIQSYGEVEEFNKAT